MFVINYRPVSVLKALSKIYEKAVSIQVTDHLTLSRRHRAAHVESQIVPLFSESLTIRAVDSVLNNARRRYEKCISLGQ